MRSRAPLETTALPLWCTSSISCSAFSRLYPNSFWNTQVTYDIRLTGSFQTMVTHGRSGSGDSSMSGTSTGMTCGAAMPPSMPRRRRSGATWSDGSVAPPPRAN